MSQPAEVQEYPYRSTWLAVVGGSAFFAVGVVVLTHLAVSKKRGLSIFGLVHLPPEGANIVYAALAVFMGLCFMLSIAALWRKLTTDHVIVVAADAISCPHGFLRRLHSTIAYAAIRELSVTTVYRERTMHIVHHGGKVAIFESMLPSKKDFDEILAAILIRTQQPQK